jgi:hypothetical protein
MHNGGLLSHKDNDIWLESKWMQLEDIVLREVSQTQKWKGYMFSLKGIFHMWKIDPKDKHIHKNKHEHIQTHVEHVCNSETTLWNSGKEGKEKRMIEHQQYRKILFK